MEETTQRLVERMQALEGELVRQQTANQVMQTVLQGAVANGAGVAQPPGPPAWERPDARALGKPDQFMGEQVKWRDWKVVMSAYAAALHPQLAHLMRVAETTRESVLAATFENEAQRSATRLLGFSLVMLCRGPALDMVVNSGADEGLQG